MENIFPFGFHKFDKAHNRTLLDVLKREIIGDVEANSFLARENRVGYQINL
jgi:hypothetical protein